MSKKVKMQLDVVATDAGKIRISLTFHHQLSLRGYLYSFVQDKCFHLIKEQNKDLKRIQTLMGLDLLSQVYTKLCAFDGRSRIKYSLTISIAQACALVIALAPSDYAHNIELKAALLKAL